jgi:phenylacetate-CoA ligase
LSGLKTEFFLKRYGLFKKGAAKDFHNALENQFLKEEELAHFSWIKTKKMLQHAYRHVPWYKRKFDAIGLRPEDITEPTHYSQVPVLKRVDLVTHFKDFVAEGYQENKLHIITTGGSSGNPLKIGVDPTRIREIQKWQMLSWWGLSPNTDMASIYRPIKIGRSKQIALSFINWPRKFLPLDASLLSDQNIIDFLTGFKKYKPKVLHGYLGALDRIADYVLTNTIENLPSPKVIWSTAAPLTKIQSQKISKAFGSQVCDQYGCSEMYFVAAACPNNHGMHQFADTVYMEVVDQTNHPVSKGVSGKLLLTNLDEFAFPLIRYENGDTGKWLTTSCSCGIHLPLMGHVKGRTADSLELPDGSVLSGEYLTTIFDDWTDEVSKFQIIQKKDKGIILRIVPHKGSRNVNEALDHVRKQLEFKINHQVSIELDITDEIKSANGKLKYIIKER